MMLRPHHIGLGDAGGHRMHVLHVRIAFNVGRHVRRVKSFAPQLPTHARILAVPNAAARDGNGDVITVTRINANRVQTGMIVATAEPAFAPFIEPQRIHQMPACATVL